MFGLLRGALERTELSLAYQPKVELSTGRIVGAEALLRWRHPQLGMISPAEFIPLAEQTSVETAAVLRRLRSLGCDVVQGYLISRPLPAVQFVEFVKRHKLDSAFDHLSPRLRLLGSTFH